MATQSVDIKTDSWTKVAAGAAAVFKQNENKVKVNVGSTTPDGTSPYIYWFKDSFQYDGTDNIYMKSCVEDFSVVVIN